jgi:hypothetical protein
MPKPLDLKSDVLRLASAAVRLLGLFIALPLGVLSALKENWPLAAFAFVTFAATVAFTRVVRGLRAETEAALALLAQGAPSDASSRARRRQQTRILIGLSLLLLLAPAAYMLFRLT